MSGLGKIEMSSFGLSRVTLFGLLNCWEIIDVRTINYASMRPIPDYKHIMPLLRLNRAFATIGFTVKRGTWNNLHALLYQLNRQYLVTFFKYVD